MVSGVETAGLILGALPLIIKALQCYVEGVNALEKWWRYHRELVNLIRVLDAEYIRFLNTCEELLAGIVPPATLGALLGSPGGDGWKAPEIESKLQERLRRSFPPFMATVKDIQTALGQLQQKLGVDPDMTPLQDSAEVSKVSKSDLRRMKFALSRPRYNEDLERIGKNNNILAELLGQNLRWEAFCKSSRHNHEVEYNYIQQQAESVYRVLGLYWSCSCQVPHTANLRLEARIPSVNFGEEVNKGFSKASAAKKVRFRIIFTFDNSLKPSHVLPWQWKAADVEPLDENTKIADEHEKSPQLRPPLTTPGIPSRNSPPPRPQSPLPVGSLISRKQESRNSILLGARNKSPFRIGKSIKFAPALPSQKHIERQHSASSQPQDLAKIKDLCAAIRDSRCEGTYIGTLFDGLSKQNHGLYLVQKSPFDNQIQKAVSLSHRLAMVGARPKMSRLTRKNCLKLALTLASSVIQLHKTSWLANRWSKDDILFFQDHSGQFLEQPFVSKSFSAAREQFIGPTALAKSLPCVRNEMVFALGVVLTELCLGSTLKEMRTKDDLDERGSANALTDYLTCQRLVGEVYEEGGMRYGDAVRRCVYCDFDQPKASFDIEAFRKAFYRGVVMPLQEDWEDFNRPTAT